MAGTRNDDPRGRPRRPHATAFLLGLWAALAPLAAAAVADRPALDIPRIDRPPEIEAFLDMRLPRELEGKLAHVSGFTQQRPEDGEPASQKTDVYLGYDDEALYAVFVAFDDDPERVRAHLTRRENIRGDDLVEIMLDTYGDGQRAYAFVVTPLGTQWDAVWTEGRGFDTSWDTVWQSKGRLTERGYVVWMAIPFKSLRFPEDSGHDWRLIFVRDIQRNNESSFWPRVSSRVEGRLNQAATLRGLNGISPGRNIQVIPYATSTSFRALDRDAAEFERDSADADAGLDAKLVLRDSLALDLTANPDFSQVESDSPQVTVNERFEVFFPEKRPFFLENADFFSTPFNLLFTRRIRDPRAGARLTGKVGSFALGALISDDESPPELSDGLFDPERGRRARFGVLRLSRDLPRQSNLGVIYTDRAFQDGSNRVGGFDGRIKLDDNWDTRFQAVTSSSDALTADPADPANPPVTESLSDQAYSLVVNRSGRKFNTHIHHVDIGRDFRADAGFVPRVDIRTYHHDTRYSFRPEGPKLISWTPGIFMERIEDQSGIRLDRQISPRINWDFRRQTGFGIFARFGRTRVRPEDDPTLTLPADFPVDARGIRFETSFIDALSANGRIEWGKAVNFVAPDGVAPSSTDRLNGSLSLTLRPGRRVMIDTTYLHTGLDDRSDGAKILSNDIVRTRWSWQIDRRLSLRAILQYERLSTNPAKTDLESNESYNADFLVTYLVNPWTALYVGYNTNWRNLGFVDTGSGTSVERTDGDFLNDSRQLFVKLSYLFRF